jgi:hypothetical protein
MAMLFAIQASASTIYTYTDNTDPRFTGNVNYSGSFSVDSKLTDGVYSFASVANRPAGFSQNFFSTPFVDGSGVTRTASLSVFDFKVSGGQISDWNIEASSPFTRVSYSGGKVQVPVNHAAVVIFHDTTTSDFQTYYDVATSHNISPSGLPAGPGVWSSLSPVPEPENYAMLLAGLGIIGVTIRRKKLKYWYSTHFNWVCKPSSLLEISLPAATGPAAAWFFEDQTSRSNC